MFRKQKKFELSPRLKLGVGRGYSQNQVLKYGAFFCLLIAGGLTLNAVRLVFFSNISASTAAQAAPQVLGASDTKDEAVAPTVQFIEYKIQKGDTLFNVSQKFNISWTTLATLNNLKSPFTLKTGQVIKIPK
jgi:hypothetical protein